MKSSRVLIAVAALSLLQGLVIGTCGEWPGLSIATLLIACGRYEAFIDDVRVVLGLVTGIRFSEKSHRKGSLYSSTTKVCCHSARHSGFNEKNQIITQLDGPVTPDARTISASETVAPGVDMNRGPAVTWQRFLPLVTGLVIGMVVVQPCFMQWGSDHKVVTNAFALGVVLSALLLIVTSLHRPGLKEFFALFFGLFCFHGLTSLSPVNVSGAVAHFLAGFVSVITCFLPGINANLMLSLTGLVLGADSTGEHVQTLLITSGAGGLLGMILLTLLFFSMKKQVTSLLRVFLAGLMIGSIPLLWPWQQVGGYLLTERGESFPLSVTYLSPSAYTAFYGDSAHVPGALICILAGFALTWFVGRQGFKNME